MKIEFRKEKTELYTRGLLAVTVLFGVLTVLRIARFSAASTEAHTMAARTDSEELGRTDMGELLAPTKASADQLKKQNLFAPAPPKRHPVSVVLGILGDEVLINNKWYKAGDKVGDATIVAVEPTKVRIAWDGQERDFAPIGAAAAGGSARPSTTARSGGRPGPSRGAQVTVTTPGGGQSFLDGLGLSDEETREVNRLKQQWPTMSPEERKQVREEIGRRLRERSR